jgi:hypothetical protein
MRSKASCALCAASVAADPMRVAAARRASLAAKAAGPVANAGLKHVVPKADLGPMHAARRVDPDRKVVPIAAKIAVPKAVLVRMVAVPMRVARRVVLAPMATQVLKAGADRRAVARTIAVPKAVLVLKVAADHLLADLVLVDLRQEVPAVMVRRRDAVESGLSWIRRRQPESETQASLMFAPRKILAFRQCLEAFSCAAANYSLAFEGGASFFSLSAGMFFSSSSYLSLKKGMRWLVSTPPSCASSQ